MSHTLQTPPALDPSFRMMRYDAAKKSAGVAYLLLFVLGGLGVHRFYLGHWFTGLVLLLMIPLAFASFGLSLLLSGLILFLDLFTIGGMVKKHNEKVIRRLTKESTRVAAQQTAASKPALRLEPRL